jgi:CheY-like chemotaxis protein
LKGSYGLLEKGFEVKCNTVLIVDDDENIRDILKMTLELEGYEAVTAIHGQAGLEALRQMPEPCLVLLDLMMPVMDGWEFARIVEADSALKKIPIAVVTAFTDKAEAIHAKQLLKKPIDLDSLLRVVKCYCPCKS